MIRRLALHRRSVAARHRVPIMRTRCSNASWGGVFQARFALPATFYPGCAGVDYFNSSELRVLDIDMVQTVKVRSSRSAQTIEQRQRERWVLKEADETKILDLCW